jgi:hypothetical protein
MATRAWRGSALAPSGLLWGFLAHFGGVSAECHENRLVSRRFCRSWQRCFLTLNGAVRRVRRRGDPLVRLVDGTAALDGLIVRRVETAVELRHALTTGSALPVAVWPFRPRPPREQIGLP